MEVLKKGIFAIVNGAVTIIAGIFVIVTFVLLPYYLMSPEFIENNALPKEIIVGGSVSIMLCGFYICGKALIEHVHKGDFDNE